MSKIAFSQLGFCDGNSGAPIFTETFGTGIGQTELPPGTTTYTYSNGRPPNDGFYTVNSNTNGFFDWFAIQDHTIGDTNGKMLIVNSNVIPGQFYKTTIDNLCVNTSYEFSSWLINLTKSNGYCGASAIPINVNFEIWDNTDTVILASGSTGPISSTMSPNWVQYALVFQTLPGQTSVILKMKNNGNGGCGNDLAIDDIVFKSCGDNITVTDALNNSTITICSNETPYSKTLKATPDNSVFNTHFYQWQESTDAINWTNIDGETNNEVTITDINSTMYYRTLVAEFAGNLNNALCNVASEVFNLLINQLPTKPTTACWETATINNANCTWEVSGSQPAEPTDTECWETTTFNYTTCTWEVSGSQPAEPTDTECWETTTFNQTTCVWEVRGSQPAEPTDTECWETATFNQTSCVWEVSGSQPAEPTDTECWETTTFNYTTCVWEVRGSQPAEPTDTECWETTTFNQTTCVWEISGSQPAEPTDLECWETTIFNQTTCIWDVLGDQPLENKEEFVTFCEGETTLLQANNTIANPTYLWNTGETTSILAVDTPGNYTVEITDGCLTTIITFTVNKFDVPQIGMISSVGNEIVINTTNTGNFEYSIDGINYQSSNIFYNTEGGLYTIYVKSVDCIEAINAEHLHFYIPQFFTPNNDTKHETFDLKGIENFESSEVYIYNRFGKLLASSKNTPFSWDGTYNNNLLPTADYWYVVIIEGQRRVGHFTLKR